MAIISPLSSPEYVQIDSPHAPLSADNTKDRRLTHDLEEESVNSSPANNQVTRPTVSWSFLDQYNDIVGLDKEEIDFPFDENGDAVPLPPSLPQLTHSSESFSSQGSSVQSEPHTLQDAVSTPLPNREVKVQALLGDALERGDCTYDFERNLTLSKLSKTRSNHTDSSLISQSPFTCNVSSTPLKTRGHNDLANSHAVSALDRKASVKSNIVFNNVMYKSPIHSPKSFHAKPMELAIKPADSTVNLDIGCELLEPVNQEEALLKKAAPPPVAESTTRTIPSHKAATDTNAKQLSHLPAPRRKSNRSVLPVIPGKLSRNRAGTGLQSASSTSSLTQISSRSSLLPTSLKSRSHERINYMAATSGHASRKLH